MTAKKKPAKKAAKKTAARTKTTRKAPVRKPARQGSAAASATGKHAGGRPTDYRPEYVDKVYRLALLGAKDTEIAAFFEVSESTLNLWKLEHPEFSESIRSGKDEADANVAKSLYNRAVGMKVDGKEVPPDVTAAKFWLINRQRHNWTERSEHALAGARGEPPIGVAQTSVDTSKWTPQEVFDWVATGKPLPGR